VATVYISSTYTDLKDYREAAARTLRKMRHEVVGMEDYVAADERPLAKCLRDVAAADAYVGIFAWRYGFVPDADNPQRRSITELEYRCAQAKNVPCLIFLLQADAPWPTTAIDAISGDAQAAKRILKLREELQKERLVSFFRTPDELGREVGVSVYLQFQLEQEMGAALREAGTLLPDELADTDRVRFGSTLFPEIEQKLTAALEHAGSSELLEVNLGRGRTWWSTRLYLLAALASDFVDVRQIVFLAGKRRFVGLASPAATAGALRAAQPRIAEMYRPAHDARMTIFQFSLNAGALGQGGEQAAKEWVTERRLREWLDDKLDEGRIESPIAPVTPFLLYRILDRSERYVPIVDRGELAGLVDRLDLATRVAKDVLGRRLESVG
jgi:hypothetical protein